MVEGGCSWLHTSPPACDKSYADALGRQYDNAQIVYACCTAIACLLSGGFLTRGVLLRHEFHKRRTGAPRAVRIRPPVGRDQVLILLLLNVMSLTFVIRAIDPFAWSLTLPPTVIYVAYDTASSCAVSVLLIVLKTWIRSIVAFTKSASKLSWVQATFTLLHASVWISFNILGILQVNAEPFWLYHTIKLSVGAVVIGVSLALMVHYGGKVYRFISATAADEDMRKQIKSTLAARETTHKDLDDETNAPRAELTPCEGSTSHAQHRPRAETDPGINRSRRGSFMDTIPSVELELRLLKLQAAKEKGFRIIKIMVYCAAGFGAGIILQLFFIYESVSNHRTLADAEAPTGVSDIMLEAAFDMLQFLGVVIASCFFGHVNRPSTNTANTVTPAHGPTPMPVTHSRRNSSDATYAGVTSSRSVKIQIERAQSRETRDSALDLPSLYEKGEP